MPALDRGSSGATARSPAPASQAARYDRVAAWLHWVIGVAAPGARSPSVFCSTRSRRAERRRAPAVINLHKSFGIVLGVLIVVRIAWRLAHTRRRHGRRRCRRGASAPPTSAMSRSMPAWWSRRSPGYIGSNFSKHGVRFFGVVLRAVGTRLAGGVLIPGRRARREHRTCCSRSIAGHVAMALRHALVERDGVFARIVPWRPRAARCRFDHEACAARLVLVRAALAVAPLAAAAAPFAYVPNEGSGTLSVIDTATDQVVAEIAVGAEAARHRGRAPTAAPPT